MKNAFSKYIDSLQKNLTLTLEDIDGLEKFKKDSWSKRSWRGWFDDDY